ncbi:uncharacterized protein LOC130426950 isoform X4 [Triplophysa dalaica]|uniref:uncharacterized protein LOC130426950 isoform X4 n=1 Tax=Triplophysa dalaica TaxID=1582913 RepID=UPI0024E00CA6|nr:uncharacterized protein LOC130426950 isoform X4 [Triplophysa dalaica]
MDKRISIFIFSCFLLTWIASASGSDPHGLGAVATENTLSSGESGSTKSPTTTPGTSLSTAGSSPSPTSGKDSVESGSSSSDKLESTTIASSPASKTSTESQTDTTSTQEIGTASPTQNKTLSKDSLTTSPTTVPNLNSTSTKNHTGSGENRYDKEISKETPDKKFMWILLPAVCVLLAAITYWKFKCKKVQHRPDMTDNGTENASFQRTDSNKDGVMLLGVSKTTGGAENVI